jgi:hypothetical protein
MNLILLPAYENILIYLTPFVLPIGFFPCKVEGLNREPNNYDIERSMKYERKNK